jgi:uncharacterized membrane protein YesL
MDLMFGENSPLVLGVKKFLNLLLVNMFWLISSVPLITIGMSTTALYDVVYKDIWHDRGSPTIDFIQSCKKNFRQAFPAGAVFLLGVLFLVVDVWMLRSAQTAGLSWGALWLLPALFLVFWIVYAIWLFAGIARFEAPLKTIALNSLALMLTHLPVSFSIVVLLGVSALGIWLVPSGLFLIPILCMFLISTMISAVFRRYMTEEERTAEDERNHAAKRKDPPPPRTHPKRWQRKEVPHEPPTTPEA